uniref:Uncharacterized protein n=1 Tax=Oryza sativa subsp. indica TaxID=39946 RepID=A0A8F3AEE5_ORYSI|nr:hypothetical protein Xa7_IRBB7.11 [Oryza sativa Indica Group]
MCSRTLNTYQDNTTNTLHDIESEEEEEEERMVKDDALPDEGTLQLCGYILISTSVAAMWAGFVDRQPVSAFMALVLFLLGCGFIYVSAMLAHR